MILRANFYSLAKFLPWNIVNRDQRLIAQVRGQEIREGLPRLLVGALLLPVGTELGETVRRPGINLDVVGNAGAF